METTIPPTTPYYLIDSRSGEVLKTSTYAQRSRLRAQAEKKNQEWGAYRFFCSLNAAK